MNVVIFFFLGSVDHSALYFVTRADRTMTFSVKKTAVNTAMYGNKRGAADIVRFVINWPRIIRMYLRVRPSVPLCLSQSRPGYACSLM